MAGALYSANNDYFCANGTVLQQRKRKRIISQFLSHRLDHFSDQQNYNSVNVKNAKCKENKRGKYL